MIKAGKELIIEYCKNIKTNSIEHLEACKEVEGGLAQTLTKDIFIDYLDGHCPCNYISDSYKNQIIDECDISQSQIDISDCLTCWEKALNKEFKIEKNIVEQKALENLNRYKQIMREFEEVCNQDGITLEEGIKLLNSLQKK